MERMLQPAALSREALIVGPEHALAQHIGCSQRRIAGLLAAYSVSPWG